MRPPVWAVNCLNLEKKLRARWRGPRQRISYQMEQRGQENRTEPISNQPFSGHSLSSRAQLPETPADGGTSASLPEYLIVVFPVGVACDWGKRLFITERKGNIHWNVPSRVEAS